jgi:hypothetical protein
MFIHFLGADVIHSKRTVSGRNHILVVSYSKVTEKQNDVMLSGSSEDEITKWIQEIKKIQVFFHQI